MPEIANQNEASEKSTEFKAKIIEYGSSEHPNAPILASSGEDINLIFKIPKEIFRKLAVAAIAHLDHSGAKKARTSNSDESQNGEKSEFRFGDVVKNLDSENTNDINDAYKEDCEECDMSKSKDSKLEGNSKTCINGSSSDSEFSGESVPICESVKQTVEEKANFPPSSNDFYSTFNVSQTPSLIQAINIESIQESSTDENCIKQEHSDVGDITNENPDENESNGKLNKKMECGKDENGLKTQGSENHAVNEGDNCRQSGNDKGSIQSLSANLFEASPESENTWPNILPSMETEKIAITEIKSLESHGILTKYLKLELSDELVVLKLTSESKVFVDAVKYKETEKCSKGTEGNSEDSNANTEHKDLSLKASDCSFMDTDISVETLTADSNTITNSITETRIVNENGEHEDNLSCTSKPECETVKISEEFITCVKDENEKSISSNNSNDENCILTEEYNKQCEDAIEAPHFHADTTTDSTNSNFEDSLGETITEEKHSFENKKIETSAENCCEANIELKHVSNEELKDMTKEEFKNERIMEIVIPDTSDEKTLNEVSDAQEDANEADTSSFKKDLLKDSKFLEDSVLETAVLEKRPENSFDSNLDSFLDSTVDTNTESTSEYGDLESDDKSIVSESDDNKEDEKRVSLRRKAFESKKGIDEVDCAPTRVRTRKTKPELSKYVIPENAEVKSAKSSTLDTPSKYYQRKSPTRSTRSKSLDPTPQQTKSDHYGKNGSIVESEGQTRKTRAKTPDIIGKKDIKTTARSSPRKLQRSAASGESSVHRK